MTYAYRCPVCEKMFQAKREDARYCSDACRQKGLRRRKRATLAREIEKIKAINPAAAAELYLILVEGGEKATRHACRLFWIAADTPPAPPLAAAPVTPARVTDTARSKAIDPADVPLTPMVIAPEDCEQMLRGMSPVAQYELWLRREGKWTKAPIRAQIEALARKGHVMILDNRWRLSPSGLALARYIDQNGVGVAQWTRSMIRESRME